MNIMRWTFTMNDTHPRVHPLRSPGINHTIISTTIAMMNATFEDERDGRKSTMGMRTNAAMIGLQVLRYFYIRMMQKQKGIDLFYFLCRKRLSYWHSTHVELFGK